MDKKDLKFYVAPSQEVVELKMEGILCASQIQGLDDPDDITGGNKGRWDDDDE